MSRMAAIRRRYGVPARRGGRIIVNGRPGVITGTRQSSQHLTVRFDGETRVMGVHPTWRTEYVTTQWKSDDR